MPVSKVKLSSTMTPNEFFKKYDTYPDLYTRWELGVVPDGTGLQILFNVEGKQYLLAGPRVGKVLSVNGGSVENPDNSFLAQLQEEVHEETFGVMGLHQNDKGEYELHLNNGSRHPLTMHDDLTVLKHKPRYYAYLTFTATCDTLSLEQLKLLAVKLSPTAHFWSKVGAYLYSHTRNAPKDETFVDYWKQNYESRCAAEIELVKAYNELKGDGLLIEPAEVFGLATAEHAIYELLHNVGSYEQLQKLFKHTVGRYSERSGYYVFDASDVLTSAKNGTELRDVDGQVVAKGVFNDDAVTAVFPALGIVANEFAPAQTAGVLAAKMGAFAPASQVVAAASSNAEETFGSKP